MTQAAPAIVGRFRVEWPGFRLDADLHLPGHGVSALFGASGSGKTTVLRCLAGLQRVSGAHVAVNGVVWQDATTFVPTHRRPLGYVFQEASLFAHLTVRGNLAYGQRRVAVAERRIALDQAIELLGIAHLLDRMPAQLSGGERQRVAIARALGTSPRLLLLDEPLAALDLRRKREILPYLERLHDQLTIPMIYVSHAPDEVARLADHLVVLEQGRVVASGPLADTLARLDLPIQLGDEVGAVLEASVAERDPRWQLVRLDFAGGSLWSSDQGLAQGQRVRVRVLARDVSLSLDAPLTSSIQNQLAAQVDAIADDAQPAHSLVRLRIGPTLLLARVTRRACDALGLRPGLAVVAQVKSVALA